MGFALWAQVVLITKAIIGFRRFRVSRCAWKNGPRHGRFGWFKKRTPVWITVIPNGFPPSREWRGVFCGNNGNPWLRGDWSFFVIPTKAGIHKGAPVMEHPWSTSWPTSPSERSTYRRDQQPGKAGACGRSTFSGYKQNPHFFKTLPVYVFW